MNNHKIAIAIVGAGINGLSCGVCIQRRIPNAEVTIIAEKWLTETTSTGAAGLFRPFNVVAEKETDALRWISDSAKHYGELCASKDAAVSGIFEIGGYIVSNEEPELVEGRQYREVVPNFRRLEGNELDKFGQPWRYGCYHSTLVIEPARYMAYLTKLFESSGGEKVTSSVKSLSELSGQFQIVINCVGLGALALSRDAAMRPVRGQLVRVRAPWLKTFFMAENHTYVYPNSESVVLGGTRQLDDWDMNIREEDSSGIMYRCRKIVPALEEAPIINEWVGLRPYRASVRLEKEIITSEGDRSVFVIHNYGHGGNGISLSWGCAVDVTERVVQEIAGLS